jgi:hypothetical protein
MFLVDRTIVVAFRDEVKMLGPFKDHGQQCLPAF